MYQTAFGEMTVLVVALVVLVALITIVARSVNEPIGGPVFWGLALPVTLVRTSLTKVYQQAASEPDLTFYFGVLGVEVIFILIMAWLVAGRAIALGRSRNWAYAAVLSGPLAAMPLIILGFRRDTLRMPPGSEDALEPEPMTVSATRVNATYPDRALLRPVPPANAWRADDAASPPILDPETGLPLEAEVASPVIDSLTPTPSDGERHAPPRHGIPQPLLDVVPLAAVAALDPTAFPRARLAVSYRPEVKAVFSDMEAIGPRQVQAFLAALDADPRADPTLLIPLPFRNPRWQAALKRARARGPEALARLVEVGETLGETVDPEVAVVQIEAAAAEEEEAAQLAAERARSEPEMKALAPVASKRAEAVTTLVGTIRERSGISQEMHREVGLLGKYGYLKTPNSFYYFKVNNLKIVDDSRMFATTESDMRRRHGLAQDLRPEILWLADSAVRGERA